MGAFDPFFDVFQCDQSVAHERAENSDPLDKNSVSLGYQKNLTVSGHKTATTVKNNFK